MNKYKSKDEYLTDLQKQCFLPDGFSSGVASLEFQPEEKLGDELYQMNLSALVLEQETPVFGGVFTRNRFPGAPVIIGREMLELEAVRGVIVNNRISNVCAPDGIHSSREIAQSVSDCFGGGAFFPSSTGIIGWKLPVSEMIRTMPELKQNLQNGSILPMAEGIMTTDRFPKVRSVTVGEGRITGIVKGAGMIEPNMATMLVFLCTDLTISRNEIRQHLKNSVDRTFNRISVDSDQSTSDTALIFSSCKKAPVDSARFESALLEVCAGLAEDVVRNGEGTSHVIEVQVNQAPDTALAVGVGKAVVNSPLVKAAVYGNDPNVGRLIMAIGKYLDSAEVDLNPESVGIEIGREVVYRNGSFELDTEKENRLFAYLQNCAFNPELKGYPESDKNVKIMISLGIGTSSAKVLGSDLSYEYVRENADYRT